MVETTHVRRFGAGQQPVKPANSSRWLVTAFDFATANHFRAVVFLLLFESRLYVPLWLQVAGRMHPLVLHFPIVLLVLYAITVIVLPGKINNNEGYKNIADLLLVLTAFTSAITVNI